jgi:DNA invertase Pin-like site-specific DNA recombinase
MKTKPAKVHKIKKMLEQGKSANEIARATGASPAYVYAVKSKVKRANEISASKPVSKPENQSAVAPSLSFLSRVFNALAFWR